MFDILVAGQIVADVLVRPVDAVDFTVDTRRVDGIRLSSGGDAMNVAMDMAALGSRVAFCGCVGNDGFGAFLRERLGGRGVGTQGLRTAEGTGTSTCLCLVNSAGDRCFFYHGGANDAMRQGYVTDEMLRSCRAVHVGGAFMLPGMDGAGAARLLERARACGCRTSMDVTWDTTGRWSDLIAPCYPLLDVFMPSLNEARHLAGADDPEAIAGYFLARGVGTAIVKLGAKGCYVRDAAGAFRGGVYAVKPVDTTGAGDAFTAGFLHAGLMGMDAGQCARWGAAAAARAIQALGATDGVPGGAELEAWMAQAEYRLPE